MINSENSAFNSCGKIPKSTFISKSTPIPMIKYCTEMQHQSNPCHIPNQPANSTKAKL
jgi:hypothetical protein